MFSGSAYPDLLKAPRVRPHSSPTDIDPPIVDPSPIPSCGERVYTAQDVEQELAPNNCPNLAWDANNLNYVMCVNTNGKPAEISFTNLGNEGITLYLDGINSGNFSSGMKTLPFRFEQQAIILIQSDRTGTDSGFRAVFNTG